MIIHVCEEENGLCFPSDEVGFTMAEVRCVLTALDNKIRYQNGQPLLKKFCSHSHESEFLHKNDFKLLNEVIQTQWKIGMLYLLDIRLKSLAETEQPMKSLHLEFAKLTENKHYTEIVLFVASLLIDFHFESDCSDYMSLALRFYLNAYYFISYGNSEGINSLIVETDLVNYLKYISLHKLKKELFAGYLKEFLRHFGDPSACFCFHMAKYGDFLYYILEELFELSRGFKFNFLSLWHNGNYVFKKKYTDGSILDHCERYILLAKHGFEDRYYEDAVKDYMVGIHAADEYGNFGIENIVIKNEDYNSVTHRCFQLLFLYVKQYYEQGDASKIYKKTLQILWETIPDPYLTKHQFMYCFRSLSGDVQVEVGQAWDWYEQNVPFHESGTQTSPRTLCHISKCYIRRRLTDSAHLPSEVESLDIPRTLKNYLCVESLQLSLPS